MTQLPPGPPGTLSWSRQAVRLQLEATATEAPADHQHPRELQDVREQTLGGPWPQPRVTATASQTLWGNPCSRTPPGPRRDDKPSRLFYAAVRGTLFTNHRPLERGPGGRMAWPLAQCLMMLVCLREKGEAVPSLRAPWAARSPVPAGRSRPATPLGTCHESPRTTWQPHRLWGQSCFRSSGPAALTEWNLSPSEGAGRGGGIKSLKVNLPNACVTGPSSFAEPRGGQIATAPHFSAPSSPQPPRSGPAGPPGSIRTSCPGQATSERRERVPMPTVPGGV